MSDRGFFFCGIGGSGMLPLAMLLRARGERVEGSDRSFDQGRFPETAARLRAAGVALHPQDGSGLVGEEQMLVTSSAVESTIPDVAAAERVGADRMIRAELLSRLSNAAEVSCGIAGTSGKSTTTGMLAHVLVQAGRDPSVVNGAPILNLRDPDGRALGWRAGGEGTFVCEVDESDGSIALYDPSVGVILNVSEDHKTMEELEVLFGGFAERAGKVVLGIGSEPVAAIARKLPAGKATTFAIGMDADYSAHDVRSSAGGIEARLSVNGRDMTLKLPLIGRFNVANALAAMAAAEALGVSPQDSAQALGSFAGTARRLQTLGTRSGVTVIDDFAHNPDKIAASIGALASHYGRIHLLYQPHGYGPLRSFRPLYEKAFAESLRPFDRVFVTEPAYFGGTVDKTDDARRLVQHLESQDLSAFYLADRNEVQPHLRAVEQGDAVVVMGARDDSLTDFAHAILEGL